MDPGPISAEEESLKRNTDCIYFLASPLTCKKGTECEFRHSESARLNPRECYYWLNSNCLNPKCAFRHPPLDGLSGHDVPSTLPAAPKQISMAHVPAFNLKQSVPCIYFQKGHCLKADRCPFSHGTQAIPQNVAKASPSVPESQEAIKRESWSLKQCVTQQNISKPSTDAASKTLVSSAKSINGLSHAIAKHLLPNSSQVANNNAWSRSQNQQSRAQIQPSDEELRNGLEPGEIVGEHYSGYGAHISNNTKAQTRSSDYKKHVPSNYERNQIERNGRVHDYYEKKSQRTSEMNMERPRLPQRRELKGRSNSPDETSRSDLRHRLKQRKLDNSTDSSRYRDPLESSRSNRLKGRINIPEKDREVSRNRSRLSPTRPYDRMRRSSEEPPFSVNSRNLNNRLSRREDNNDSVNFCGPKSLAELKGKKKIVESSHENSTISQMQKSEIVVRKAVSYEEIEGSPPTFEGPKPLSELLKRKREENSANSSGEYDNNQRYGEGEVQKKVEKIVDKVESVPLKDDNLNYQGESSVKEDDALYENDDYMEVEGAEDEDYEDFDGEYEEEYDANENGYESQGEGEGEGELELNDENNDNDDDEDDFARKVGLIYS